VTTRTPDPALLLEKLVTLRQVNAALRLENATLRAETAVLHERVHDLETRLSQNSTNSSRPLSSDLPQAPAKRRPPPTGRKRGRQPGHRGAYRALLPVEQVDEVVATCRQQGRSLLDFLVAVSEAASRGCPPPSLLSAA
jgi:transposase